jgi:hypothetical protein
MGVMGVTMGHMALLSGRQLAARRAVAIAAAGALVMTALVLAIARGPHVAVPGDNVASSGSHLQWAAGGAISNSLGRDQPAFHVATRSGGLIANNPAQRLTASFGDQGVLVRSGSATFGLRLLSYGAGRHPTPVAATAPRAAANRVVYSHAAITEWFENGPLGIEQGFDVATAPTTMSGHELTIELGLRGNMQARADGSGGLLLTGPKGQQLRYTGLRASDARGRALHTSLTVGPGRAVIHVQTRGAVYPLRIDPFIQVAKFGDPNPTSINNLGSFAIDVQGTTAVASEITSNSVTNPPNAVDIFAANSGRWDLGATQVAQLTDPNDESFGASLSLTPDGRTLAVGAPDANSFDGAVFVFEEPASGGWVSATSATAARLTDTPPFPGNESVGKSVSISADGSTVAAGLPGRADSAISSSVGAVDVFERSGMHWATQTAPHATLTHAGGRTGDQLGVSVAQSGNGSTIVAGAWGFGSTATPSLGEAWVWQQPSSGWATNGNPNAVLLAPNAASDDFFGGAAAISADAKTIVIGATGYQGNRGAAFVFTSPNGTWTSAPPPSATLMSSDGQQEGVGRSVATDGRLVVSGTFSVAIGGNMGQGAAYVFVMPPSGWSSENETVKLTASDGKAGDSLGQTVGISNGTVIAAAPFADATGHTDQGFLYAFATFPTTAISLTPAAPDGSNGWYVHPVNVAASASDLASTVTAINCVLDPASAPTSFGALPASCPFLAPGGATVAANGRHAFYAAAVNAAGYAASPVSRSFQIDTVAPQVTCSPTPDFPLRGNGGLVAATVADGTSGPAAPIVAAPANVSRPGKQIAILTGRDNAGNSTTVSCGYRVVAPRVATTFPYTFSAFARYTIFFSLTARKIPRGAQLTITCKGRGCPFKRRVVHPPNTRLVCKPHHKHCKRKPALALENMNLEPLVAHRHLAVNAKLTFTVTKPDTIGVVSVFTIRRSAGPRITGPTCLAPGSTKPGKGC